jgi:hypothetical protein
MFGSSSWQLLKLVRLLRWKELVRVLRIHGIGDYIPDSHMSFMDACGSVVRDWGQIEVQVSRSVPNLAMCTRTALASAP